MVRTLYSRLHAHTVPPCARAQVEEDLRSREAARDRHVHHAPGLPGHEELHLTAGGSDRSSHDGARVPVDEARAATEYCLAIVLRNFIVCASGRSEASLMTGIVPPTLDEYIALLRFAPAVLALDAAAAAAAAGV